MATPRVWVRTHTSQNASSSPLSWEREKFFLPKIETTSAGIEKLVYTILCDPVSADGFRSFPSTSVVQTVISYTQEIHEQLIIPESTPQSLMAVDIRVISAARVISYAPTTP